MTEALRRIKAASLPCVGTITIDSFTRVGDHISQRESLARGEELNGYPIVTHPAHVTRNLVHEIADDSFPLQVRHGTPRPLPIFRRMVEVGIDATEGGPVSYCLPYGRTPLAEAVRAWRDAAHLLADELAAPHIETFGGCLLGQLCPPSLLVAISLLEALFFQAIGIRSVSLSYAQGPSRAQDLGALSALRQLAAAWLPDTDWHLVLYTYMGVFPQTQAGARRLIEDSARLARAGGCDRLIVKTAAERRQIPSVPENLEALRWAHIAAGEATLASADPAAAAFAEEVLAEASALIVAVLDLDPDIGEALHRAFERGILDVPFCLHADNAGLSGAAIDRQGVLRWTQLGNLPIGKVCGPVEPELRMTSVRLLAQLNFLADRYDLEPCA